MGYSKREIIEMVKEAMYNVADGNVDADQHPLVGLTFAGQFDLNTGGEASYKIYPFNTALTPTTTPLVENSVCRVVLDAGSSASLVTTNIGSARVGSDTFTISKKNEVLVFCFPDGVDGVLVVSHSIKVLN